MRNDVALRDHTEHRSNRKLVRACQFNLVTFKLANRGMNARKVDELIVHHKPKALHNGTDKVISIWQHDFSNKTHILSRSVMASAIEEKSTKLSSWTSL